MTVRELDKLIRQARTNKKDERLTQYLSRQDLNSPAQLIIMVREYRL